MTEELKPVRHLTQQVVDDIMKQPGQFDRHSEFAAYIYNCAAAEVTPVMRAYAKGEAFRYIYSVCPGASMTVGFPSEEIMVIAGQQTGRRTLFMAAQAALTGYRQDFSHLEKIIADSLPIRGTMVLADSLSQITDPLRLAKFTTVTIPSMEMVADRDESFKRASKRVGKRGVTKDPKPPSNLLRGLVGRL